jgi:hypothetical protein
MFYRTILTLLIITSLIILTSCHKEKPDKTGELPYLRGMSVTWNERMKVDGSHTLSESPDKSWFTLADVQRMKSAGATCLELHQIGLPTLMSNRNIPDESFFTDWIDIWVNWCSQNEMYCIINITGFGAWADWAFTLSMPSWLWDNIYTPPATNDKPAFDSIIRDFFDLDVTRQDINRAAFITLWKYIANRYKENPYVIFSIMNEPFWQVDIPDEAAAIHLSQTYSTFMEQIVDAIRSTGATQYVLIDLPFLWDHNWQFTVNPVDREDIIWEVHMYGSVWEPELESFKTNLEILTHLFIDTYKKPMFIGEYGINPPSSIHDNSSADWKLILTHEKIFLDSLPILGRQFTTWDDMNGEYATFTRESIYTSDDTEWIIQTVLAEK